TSELAGPFFNKVQFSDVRDLKSPNQVSLENLLSSSQVVSVNTSGDTEILTSELCELIQPGAILVITSRGESVNLEALRRLQEEKNVRVALDVFHQEGKGMFDNQMLMEVIQDKGFIGTPHTAAQDDYTQEQLGHEAAHAMIDFAQKGMVNPKNLSGLNFKSVQLSGPLDRKDKRFLIAHPSIKGTIGKIGTLVDQGGGDIRHFANDSEGFHLNGVHLAATAFDVIGVTPEQAVAIYDKIKSEIKILRGRILSYA
ncbi:MAG: NAD(P)-dependent oxidoreductase, partial [Candidatus Gracilibacteria bacterium]|nr:NAD(P)-dependent oxidoreductase [Candidatus Gracilibacteria bacterium]